VTDPVREAEALYAECAADLLAGLDAAIIGWVERSLVDRLPSGSAELATAAAVRTHEAVMPVLRALLLSDVDVQSAGPLGILRHAVGDATDVLAAAQVPRPRRDEFAARNFPDDPYDLGPATFDDVDPALHEVGLRWGAAKAHLVLTRRRVREARSQGR
jgi:hypothetical protein